MIDFTSYKTDLSKYYPEFLAEYEELKALGQAIEFELDEFHKQIESVHHNLMASTADEDGLKRFEKIYGLYPTDDATIEDRRLAILAKMTAKMPYTKRALATLLDSLVGEDGYTLRIETAEYMVYVAVELKRMNQINAISDLLRKVIPANMGYDLQIRYNQYYMLEPFAYSKTSSYTYEQLRSDTSIRDAFINQGGVLI